MIVVMAIGASEAEILGVKSQILSRRDVTARPRGRGAGGHRGRRRGRAAEAGARQPPRRAAGGRVGHPDQPAVQADLARVPSRGHGDPRARCGDRRRLVDDDGRTVLRGEPGAADGDGRCGEGRRRDHPARRRIQAAHQSLRVPGARRRGAPLPGGGARPDRAAGDHRGDGAEPGRHRRRSTPTSSRSAPATCRTTRCSTPPGGWRAR